MSTTPCRRPAGATDAVAVHLLASRYGSGPTRRSATTSAARVHARPARRGGRRVPGQLLELSGELTARFAGLVAASTARLESAVAAGLDVVDVTHRVPPQLADGCRRLLHLLDEADDYCRSGHLLTVTSSPLEVAFRRWYLGQFVAQVDGQAPQRWGRPARLTARRPLSRVGAEVPPEVRHRERDRPALRREHQPFLDQAVPRRRQARRLAPSATATSEVATGRVARGRPWRACTPARTASRASYRLPKKPTAARLGVGRGDGDVGGGDRRGDRRVPGALPYAWTK
jgi:hypothetical protein